MKLRTVGIIILAVGAGVVVVRRIRRQQEQEAQPFRSHPTYPPSTSPVGTPPSDADDVVEAVGVMDEPPPPPDARKLTIPRIAGFSFAPNDDTTDSQALWALLQQEGFRQRGEGFRNSWAFHIYASTHHLGMPLAPSANTEQRLEFGGNHYGYQVFACDTLFNEVPQWSNIQSLSQMINGTMPESGLALKLLEISYKAGNTELHTNWSFHRFAVQHGLGPAIGEARRVTADGNEYSMQVFACDTLYNQVPNWTDVKQLRETPAGNLATVLWQETYKVSGAPYDANSPFHNIAIEKKLGTPLSGIYGVDMEGTTLQVQVFASGVLYAYPGGQPILHTGLPTPSMPDIKLVEPPSAVSEPSDAMSSTRPLFTMLPIAGQPRISQLYGYTKWAAGDGRDFYRFCQGRHPGIDFAVPIGTPLIAIGHGVVVWAGTNSPFASGPRSIVVRYGAIYAIYGHVSSEAVKRGDVVVPGQHIGASGTLGGPHLHFELRDVPERVLHNTDPMQAPVNPGSTTNPVEYFDATCQAYFDKWYRELGGDSHYCVGSMRNQEHIVFGGPVDTRPCTNP